MEAPQPSKVEVLEESTRTATEFMDCEACKYIQTQDQQTFLAKLTPKEYKVIAAASRRKWQIIPGMMYTSHLLKINGKEYRSNFQRKVWEICVKYKVI